jgi:hypothetical protein
MSQRLFFAGLAAALAAAFLVVYHQSARSDVRAMETALQDGLKRFYDSLPAEQANGTNAALFTSQAVSQSLRAEFAQRRFLPSFARLENTAVSTSQVARGTTNLLCVIQPWKNTRYGLDGGGACRTISDAEFQNWPHSALSAQ